jgi:hypothetical protein
MQVPVRKPALLETLRSAQGDTILIKIVPKVWNKPVCSSPKTFGMFD